MPLPLEEKRFAVGNWNPDRVEGFNEALDQASSCEIDFDKESLGLILESVMKTSGFKCSSGELMAVIDHWKHIKPLLVNEIASTPQSWLRIRKAAK